jgi:hypothetical protein
MSDCKKRHTELGTGHYTRQVAATKLLKTHSCQKCPDCGKWAIYVPKGLSQPR